MDQIVSDLVNILELRNEHHHYREVVDLEEEWLQAISLLKDTLRGNEEIVVNFKELPTIITVRTMFQNVLYNLLSNAIKFKSPERKLKIVATSQLQDGHAVLEVTDNGLGFNTERHQEKIFKLYRRFHANVGGRGRGLYLIKIQVELLHGSVDVKSEVNKGSTFRVVLPLSIEESFAEQEYRL